MHFKKKINVRRIVLKNIINLFDTQQPIYFYQLVSFIANCVSVWPLKDGVSKSRSVIYYFIWWTFVINVILLLLPLLMTTYLHLSHNRFSEFTISLLEVTSITDGLISYIVYETQKSRLRVLLNLTKHRLIEISKDRYKTTRENLMNVIKLYFITVLLYSTTVLMHVYDAYFIKLQELPVSAIYPFPTCNPYVKGLLLLNQVLVVFSNISLLIVDGMCIGLMYAAIVKLDILKQECGKACVHSELVNGVKYHKNAIWFIAEVNASFRLFFGKTILAYASYFIIAGLTLVHSPIFTLTFEKCALIVITCTVRLHIFAQTADRIAAKCFYTTFSLLMTIQTIRKKLNMDENARA